MTAFPKRFEVHLVELDPTEGSEIRKTRPCLIVSPDEMNRHLRTVIIAPMTSARRPYPTRVDCTFQKVHGQVALDQLRAVDRTRLIKRLGTIHAATKDRVIDILGQMFAA